ncbi:sensor histidine kinase [Methylobacterium brachiatum]|uniref:sensor histidine kinase n=1 Tax=Methylobacterium brachiatum TaxID=269660 RepID=UPI0008E2464C|nr:PAS domain-containing sensor histidine kinase [Methylobacterium brachiatum]AYO82713.1 PAS domain-containing sensor histidine kinase [Methylobacterium brachiatum]MCB4804881.1 PAS-domain containing protein [Methylobacterium brachiatum]MDF2601826.1 sensor protein DivL [Methylobacterium brachiatum]CAA2159847.1 Sensor protein DivL [Methylobacterium brachiatum]SFI68453.1 PAS fold [Methylobacterium brachiatum]
MGVGRAAHVRICVGALTLTAASAALAELPETATAHAPREMHGVAALAIFGGLVAFAVILSLLHLYERSRWTRRERELAGALDVLRGAHDRAEMLLNAERQIIVTWDRRSEPVVEGDISLAIYGERPTSGYARRVLAFGTWLVASDAAAVEAAVETLRARGTSFTLSLRTQTGRSIDAHGQAVAGRALLRLRETSQERCEIADLRATLDETRRGLSALAGLLDAIPQPVWRRNREGGLSWVNAAYVAAVEAESREATLDRGIELFDRPAREAIARDEAARAAGLSRSVPRLSAVMAGSRRMLDVFETTLDSGRVGIAIDVSELESVRADLQRQMNANVRTLDQLPTAVAMFDVSQRLIFHNAAYRQLWDLDQAFLDSRPSDGEILDHLRAERKLEEHADFRGWKQGVLAAYRAAEANQSWWYLPDGRTLRVVADPNPQGGLTYLFDDVSDSLNAESRYNALRRLQAETLDTLAEPVAVFGADGRMTLANRAFCTVWRLDPAAVEERPHVDAVIESCRSLAPAEEPWLDIRDAVVGLESRTARSCRLEVVDGTVLDCAAQPLPEGATLLTLIDVTASVNVERALTEKNDALEKAAQLRDTFVHHVSYELRSPLTNIIGFTQLLGDETVGALNDRQREYSDHIMRSSAALLVIINDILDLASIDAGSLELQREEVDVQSTIEAAVRGIEDRLAESHITLALDVPEDIGSVHADGKRVRQILFNLLSNAVGFSDAGQRVEVRARREAHDLVLSVRDHGRGMPPEIADSVFNRFESHTLGTRHRGVGLGLSIVRSFVELHGGRVHLETAPGAGTQVTCTFPLFPLEGPRLDHREAGRPFTLQPATATRKPGLALH